VIRAGPRVLGTAPTGKIKVARPTSPLLEADPTLEGPLLSVDKRQRDQDPER
jgi:hypothetical protein